MPVNFEVDFTPLGKLAQHYQQAQQQRQTQDWLQQQGLPGNLSLAQLALANQRDARDFALRERLASPEHAASTQRATLAVQNEFAPKTVDIKLPGGETVTVQKGPGGYELPAVQGMPAPDPNAPQPPPGVDAKKWREARATQFANIDDKAVQEAEKAVQASTQAVESLTKAKELSKKALSGPLAGKIGYGLSLAPDYFSNAKAAGVATEELTSTVTSQALENLRATFGGNPTEGERKILMDVQGAVNQAPEVREKIYQNAIEAAQKRIEFNKRTAEQMRAGTYLLPEGQRNAPQSQQRSQAQPQPFNWKSRETIMGARQNPQETIAQAKAAVAKGMPVQEAVSRLKAAGIPVDASTFGAQP